MLLSWIKSLSGYGTPILAGLVIYLVFSFLDRRASPEARSAIADLLDDAHLFSWLQPTARNRDAVADAIRELFDRIYVRRLTAREGSYAQVSGGPYWKPLATWRAFFRSAFITIVVTYILTYVIFRSPYKGVSDAFLSGILINILCDYFALYVIRMWLAQTGISAQEALFIAPMAGILLVISFMGLRLIFFMPIELAFGSCYPANAALKFCEPGTADGAGVTYLSQWAAAAVQHMSRPLASLQFPGVLAACLVHVWLPLFALCVGILKLFHGARRFLGRDHPLEAIGVVAALLTFVTVASLQGLAAVLHFS